MRVDLSRARAHWCAKLGLAPYRSGTPAEIVAATGWVRTLGGIDVYLAVRARCPSLTRADLDRAVAERELCVIPAARGCIYLVPSADVPMALALAESLWRPRTERDLAKAGSDWNEVQTLANAVAKTLAREATTTHALRKALPDGAVRSLGAPGKKVGLSSPLPVALRLLEFEGRIERTLEDGRLDTERYHWRLVPRGQKPSRSTGSPSGSARASRAASPSTGTRNAFVAEHFLRVAGPATVKQFAVWSGLSQREAKAAIAAAGGVAVVVDDFAAQAWVLEDDLAELQRARTPAPSFALLPFEDNIITIHGGPAVHVDPAYHDVPIDAWGSARATTLGAARHIGQRPLLCGDQIVGFWEYDIVANDIVTRLLHPLPRKAAKELVTQRSATAAFIRDELGHAKSFSLDDDESIMKRARALRS